MSESLHESYDEKEFNDNVNLDVINGLYEKAKVSLSSNTDKIQEGKYIVAITDMCIGNTKTGKSALKIVFTISDGENIGKKLYYTQVINSQFGLDNAIRFLNKLGVSDMYITKSSEQILTNNVKFLYERIKDTCEYDLKYSTNYNGYPEYNIVGIYDLV